VKRAAKTLPVLLVLLVLVAGAGGYVFYTVYYPQMQEKATLDQVGARVRSKSALLAAAMDVEDQKGAWPKSIEELKGHPRVQELEPGDLKGVTYTFKGVGEDGFARYEYSDGNRTEEIRIQPKKEQATSPSMGRPQ
jgi:hypothetical protein